MHEELQSVIAKLEKKELTDNGTHVSIASAAFIQEGYSVQETFINSSKQIYQSEVFKVDFKYNAELGKEKINK